MPKTKTVKTDWIVLVPGDPTRAVCERCGREHVLKFPMEIWELGTLADGFTREHKACKLGPDGKHCTLCLKTGHASEACPKLAAGTPAQWRAGPDTGVSSCTIYGALMGYGYAAHFVPDVPYDRCDFGRCFRLVERFEWRARLPEVAAKHPAWAPFVRDWDALTDLYRAETWSTLRAVLSALVDESRRPR